MNRIWLGLLASLTTATLFAQDQADWLQRMDQAARTVSYRGDFVFVRGDQMRHMRVVHLVDELGVHQRVSALDGPPTEILLGGGRVVVATAGNHRQQTDAGNLPFSTVLPQRLQALSGLYHITLGGIERVAEHQAQVVNVQPEDGYRFGFRLWSELGSGLLLRAQMRDSSGEVIEQFSFSRVELEATAGQITAAETQGQPAANPQMKKSVQIAAWRVAKVPRGFSLQSTSRYAGQHAEMVDHLLFSDGLATVSVFIEPLQAGFELATQSVDTGMVNALTGTISDNQVTVMGEVPVATLSMILHSLQPMQPPTKAGVSGNAIASSTAATD